MLSVQQTQKIYLCTAPTDMRKGFHGLGGLVASGFCDADGVALSPADGSVFVFVNRRRDRIKLLHFDGHGMAIYYKQLEAGTLQLPTAGSGDGRGRPSMKIDAAVLAMMLGGIDLARVKRRKRYGAPGSGAPGAPTPTAAACDAPDDAARLPS